MLSLKHFVRKSGDLSSVMDRTLYMATDDSKIIAESKHFPDISWRYQHMSRQGEHCACRTTIRPWPQHRLRRKCGRIFTPWASATCPWDPWCPQYCNLRWRCKSRAKDTSFLLFPLKHLGVIHSYGKGGTTSPRTVTCSGKLAAHASGQTSRYPRHCKCDNGNRCS